MARLLIGSHHDAWALDDEVAQATLKGISGVIVWVGDIPPAIVQQGVTQQQLHTAVEQQLRRAGIVVFAQQDTATVADVAVVSVAVTTLQHTSGLYAYTVDLAVYQAAALFRDPTPRSMATWTVGALALVEASDLRAIFTSVRQEIQKFIQAYQTVHPKAKRKTNTSQTVAQALVRQAQARLQGAGFAPGPPDGKLGPQTRLALQAYQQSKGLPVTGKLDPRTIKALRLQ